MRRGKQVTQSGEELCVALSQILSINHSNSSNYGFTYNSALCPNSLFRETNMEFIAETLPNNWEDNDQNTFSDVVQFDWVDWVASIEFTHTDSIAHEFPRGFRSNGAVRCTSYGNDVIFASYDHCSLNVWPTEQWFNQIRKGDWMNRIQVPLIIDFDSCNGVLRCYHNAGIGRNQTLTS